MHRRALLLLLLLLPLALAAFAQDPARRSLEIPDAIRWVEEQGEAPLSARWEFDAEDTPFLVVASSARGMDEEAAGALLKIYRGDARVSPWSPEESIVLDGPTLLRLGAQQTILGLSTRTLSSFAKAAAEESKGRVLSLEPRRLLREPRISVLVDTPAGRQRLRYHAVTGAYLGRGERIDFEGWTIGSRPAGFAFGRTGQGRPGSWVVRARGDAAGGERVLVQEDDEPTDNHFPVAVLEDVLLRDGSVSARCRPMTGSVDQAVGLVFRYLDEDNYYVTRANALENNVRLYYVKAGKRVEIAGFDGDVAARKWHDLKAVFHGPRIEVFWDGARVIQCEDRTIFREGAVGLWTKADSVSEFDDLVAETD